MSINNIRSDPALDLGTELMSPCNITGNISFQVCQGGTGDQPNDDDQLLVEVPVRLQEYVVKDDYVPQVQSQNNGSLEFENDNLSESSSTIKTKSSKFGHQELGSSLLTQELID